MDLGQFDTGDIISWQNETNEQRTIAIYYKGGMFQLAVHYRSEQITQDNTFRIWWYDGIPQEVKELRKANKDEILELVWILIENGTEFRMTAKRQIFLPEYDNNVGTTDEIDRWTGYLTELCTFYQFAHNLKKTSILRSQYHVGGVTKEQFFELKLNEKKPEDINVPLVCNVIKFVKNARKKENYNRRRTC